MLTRQELAGCGCDGRILAELTSEAPESQSQCLHLQRVGQMLRGRIRGLDRKHPRAQIATALTDFSAQLLDIIRAQPW